MDELFNPIIMRFVSSDVHKNQDWNLELYYNNYTQERVITHLWYVRWEIVAEAKTFTECSKKFIELVRDANLSVIIHYYSENKWLQFNHEQLLDWMNYSEIIEFLDDMIEEQFKWDSYKNLLNQVSGIIKDAKDKWVEFEDVEDENEQFHLIKKAYDNFENNLKYESAARDFYKWVSQKTPFWLHTILWNEKEKLDNIFNKYFNDIKELKSEEDVEDEDDVIEDKSLEDEEDFWKIEYVLWETYWELKTLPERLKDDWIRVHSFIKDLETGRELWSKYEWQYVPWRNCAIDDTRYYCRFLGTEWVDYEIVEKPLEMCVQRWTYGKDWKWPLEMKRIWELDKEHIEAILKTQKLKPSLRELFEMVLEKRSQP